MQMSVHLFVCLIKSVLVLTIHTSDRLEIIILVMSQFSIFDTRYRFGLANQGFQGLRLYDLDCFV